MKVGRCQPNNWNKGGTIDLEEITYDEATRLKNILLADKGWECWRELIKALDLVAAANESVDNDTGESPS